MKKNSLAAAKLSALLGAHFYVDLVSGMLAGFLPVALIRFNLDLSLGVVLITSLGIGSNFLQVPAAKVAAHRSGPWALIAGLVLCSAFTCLGFLPGNTPLWLLCLIMFLVGAGIALVHPQGLRGVQNLHSIPAAVSTPVFMVGGFLGYAISPFAGGMLVGRLGLPGLFWVLLIAAAVIAAILYLHVEVAIDAPDRAAAHAASGGSACPWNFCRMWFMALFLNTGTLTISSLVPTMLHDKGFSLTFGGFSAMLFGLGSACGSLSIGYLAKSIRPEKLIVRGLWLGIPAGLLYLAFCNTPAAAAILFLAGLGAAAGFPQMVALVRDVPSRFSLSVKTGLLVGWTWGSAGILFLGIGFFADHCSIRGAVLIGVLLYGITLLLAMLCRSQRGGN